MGLFGRDKRRGKNAPPRKRAYHSDSALREFAEDLDNQRLLLIEFKDKIENVISQFNESIDGMAGSRDLAAVKEEIAGLKKSIALADEAREKAERAAAGSAGALESKIGGIARDVETLDREVKALKDEGQAEKDPGLSGEAALREALEGSIAGLREELSALREESSGLAERVAERPSLRSALDSLKERVESDIGAGLERLRSDVSAIADESARREGLLESRLKKIAAFFEEKAGSLGPMRAEIEALKEQVAADKAGKPDVGRLRRELAGRVDEQLRQMKTELSEAVGTGFTSTQDDDERMKKIIRAELMRVIEPLNEKFDELSAFKKKVASIEDEFENFSHRIKEIEQRKGAVIEEAGKEVRRIKEEALRQKKNMDDISKDIDRIS